jgi:hypothetical protein
VADEPAGTRPGEHDGMDTGIAVDTVHEIVELIGDIDAEQAVRAAVDPHDQDRSAVLDLKVAGALVCHGFCFRCDRSGEANERYRATVEPFSELGTS